eukprot:m.72838 g.72838  ORF g.72838 m.72838 type:complete len:960 (+) comp16993_c0_seq1:208-3087(+)
MLAVCMAHRLVFVAVETDTQTGALCFRVQRQLPSAQWEGSSSLFVAVHTNLVAVVLSAANDSLQIQRADTLPLLPWTSRPGCVAALFLQQTLDTEDRATLVQVVEVRRGFVLQTVFLHRDGSCHPRGEVQIKDDGHPQLIQFPGERYVLVATDKYLHVVDVEPEQPRLLASEQRGRSSAVSVTTGGMSRVLLSAARDGRSTITSVGLMSADKQSMRLQLQKEHRFAGECTVLAAVQGHVLCACRDSDCLVLDASTFHVTDTLPYFCGVTHACLGFDPSSGAEQVVVYSQDKQIRTVQHGRPATVLFSSAPDFTFVCGLWVLAPSPDADASFVVLSFAEHTELMAISLAESGLEFQDQSEKIALVYSSATLHCALTSSGFLVQAVDDRIVSVQGERLCGEWRPQEGRISVVHSRDGTVVVFIPTAHCCVVLEVDSASGTLCEKGNLPLEHEASALHVLSPTAFLVGDYEMSLHLVQFSGSQWQCIASQSLKMRLKSQEDAIVESFADSAAGMYLLGLRNGVLLQLRWPADRLEVQEVLQRQSGEPLRLSAAYNGHIFALCETLLFVTPWNRSCAAVSFSNVHFVQRCKTSLFLEAYLAIANDALHLFTLQTGSNIRITTVARDVSVSCLEYVPPAKITLASIGHQVFVLEKHQIVPIFQTTDSQNIDKIVVHQQAGQTWVLVLSQNKVETTLLSFSPPTLVRKATGMLPTPLLASDQCGKLFVANETVNMLREVGLDPHTGDLQCGDVVWRVPATRDVTSIALHRCLDRLIVHATVFPKRRCIDPDPSVTHLAAKTPNAGHSLMSNSKGCALLEAHEPCILLLQAGVCRVLPASTGFAQGIFLSLPFSDAAAVICSQATKTGYILSNTGSLLVAQLVETEHANVLERLLSLLELGRTTLDKNLTSCFMHTPQTPRVCYLRDLEKLSPEALHECAVSLQTSEDELQRAIQSVLLIGCDGRK